MDPMHAYKPTTDQVKMVARMDLELVRQRSRSFRRLEHALTEVLSGQSGTVTPPPKEKQSNRV